MTEEERLWRKQMLAAYKKDITDVMDRIFVEPHKRYLEDAHELALTSARLVMVLAGAWEKEFLTPKPQPDEK